MKTDTITGTRTRLMDSLIRVPACQTKIRDTDWFPAVDLRDTGQEYVFEVDLPGLKPTEVKLQVDSAGVSISGQRPSGRGGKRLRVERPSGLFVRHLPLPPNAHGEIRATFGDGVLELRIPKGHDNIEPNPARAVDHEPEEVAS